MGLLLSTFYSIDFKIHYTLCILLWSHPIDEYNYFFQIKYFYIGTVLTQQSMESKKVGRTQSLEKSNFPMCPWTMCPDPWGIVALGEVMPRVKTAEPWGRIFKFLRSPGIDSKESIPPSYVALRAGTTTLFLLGFLTPIDCLKIPALRPGVLEAFY